MIYRDINDDSDPANVTRRVSLRNRIQTRARRCSYANYYQWASRVARAYVRIQQTGKHPGREGTPEQFEAYTDARNREAVIALIWHEGTIQSDQTLREFLLTKAREAFKRTFPGP